MTLLIRGRNSVNSLQRGIANAASHSATSLLNGRKISPASSSMSAIQSIVLAKPFSSTAARSADSAVHVSNKEPTKKSMKLEDCDKLLETVKKLAAELPKDKKTTTKKLPIGYIIGGFAIVGASSLLFQEQISNTVRPYERRSDEEMKTLLCNLLSSDKPMEAKFNRLEFILKSLPADRQEKILTEILKLDDSRKKLAEVIAHYTLFCVENNSYFPGDILANLQLRTFEPPHLAIRFVKEICQAMSQEAHKLPEPISLSKENDNQPRPPRYIGGMVGLLDIVDGMGVDAYWRRRGKINSSSSIKNIMKWICYFQNPVESDRGSPKSAMTWKTKVLLDDLIEEGILAKLDDAHQVDYLGNLNGGLNLNIDLLYYLKECDLKGDKFFEKRIKHYLYNLEESPSPLIKYARFFVSNEFKVIYSTELEAFRQRKGYSIT